MPRSSAADLLGLLTGALLLAAWAANGTNNAVLLVGAHLGSARQDREFLLRRFFSLSVWSSGDALIGGAHRLLGVPESDLA